MTVVQVSPTTLRRVKEIKEISGVAIGRLADLGLNFFCSEIKRGTLVIRNGKIVAEPEKGNGK